MTNNDELARKLKAAAEKATKGDWRRASTRFNGITATPFSLGGEEKMLASTLEKCDAEFITTASPTNILSLLAERTADKAENASLRQRVAELEQQVTVLQQRHEIDPRTHKIIDLEERVAELETICADSYQVVGALADAAGVFETSEAVSKALDNLSGARLVHSDVLPFSVEALTVSVKLPKTMYTEFDNDDYCREVAVLDKQQVIDALTAAGIKLEVGE